MSTETPMMRQYRKIKEQHPDAILFYRMGDFYEMFGQDAVTAAPVLGVALTSRDKGKPTQVPMCGVPHHAKEPYLAKLIRAGYRVAVCEQVEDPAKAKGLVKRNVIRVVTAGTVIEPTLLSDKEPTYLAALVPGSGGTGLAWLEVSVGILTVAETDSPAALLARIRPSEIIAPEDYSLEGMLDGLNPKPAVARKPGWNFDSSMGEERLREIMGVATLKSYGVEDLPAGLAAAAALVAYLRETYPEALKAVGRIASYREGNHLTLDGATIRNLELVENMHDRTSQATLLAVLDMTLTPMGARLLRSWLLSPLTKKGDIEHRQGGVASLVDDPLALEGIRKLLKGGRDLERLTGRVKTGIATPRDLIALKTSLETVPSLRDRMTGLGPFCEDLSTGMDPLPEVVDLLERAVVDEPPASLGDGRVIREGYHPEIDRLRRLSSSAADWITQLEATERDRTGISSLKIKYNKVFGYFIEVTKTHLSKVPEDYIRKQTLVNSERFITPDLKAKEEEVLTAWERLATLEREVYNDILRRVADRAEALMENGRRLAILDTVASLATVAVRNNYCRPRMVDEGIIDIKEGRHPVVEAVLTEERFVPNDTLLEEDRRLLILTGPNMAGKSTYIRQVALMVIMAQIGSFVPADKAVIGIRDRVFTRVGASDYLAGGLSTFMVEMTETAYILHHLTSRSLVVLDEIGRGTSTFDGLSLAWAVAEYLSEPVRTGVIALFATHYHELTDLAAARPWVVNMNVAIREWKDSVIFLHKIVPGRADKSYGIQVARLAGIPSEVILRAGEILATLERGEFDDRGRPRLVKQDELPTGQPFLPFEPHPDLPVLEELRSIDADRLTPREALDLIYRLKGMLNESSAQS